MIYYDLLSVEQIVQKGPALFLLGTVPPAFAGRAGSLVIQLYICIDIIILAVYELVRTEMQV